jgi:hypothetical protein
MADTPMNPKAGVSGPGKYAVRTDNLQMGSTAYGEGIETAKIKSGSPLSRTPDQRPMPAAEVRAAATQTPITGLFEPTQRPNSPITTGIDMGPGAGSNALMMTSNFAQVKLSDTLAEMLPYDQTGEIGILYQQALARGM